MSNSEVYELLCKIAFFAVGMFGTKLMTTFGTRRMQLNSGRYLWRVPVAGSAGFGPLPVPGEVGRIGPRAGLPAGERAG